MNFPKISIVTVNFNKAKYLERTIQSVLSQNYPNLEYIIIDGGSTDESIDIIKKYSNQLAYWVSEPDNGMYFALKKGFEHATGDIYAWINSDDMYHRNSFFIVAEIFSSMHQVDWLVGASTHWDEYDRCVNVFHSRYFNRVHFLLGDMKFVQQESSFWRRSLYEKVGGIPTEYKLAGDFALWMKFSRQAKMFLVNALLGGFRISKDEQLSNDMTKYMGEVQSIIENEEIDIATRNRINQFIRRKKKIDKINEITHAWLNIERIRSYYNRDLIKEEQSQRIYFNSSQYKFLNNSFDR